ncbi:MAG TPA: YggS family pyridoxal phosphate-dependent enzyme [Mycobacteriales bacterium]|nr:YggS family pyridoxal phosphate-dependent enzyme [Mycobacteriales bacterium]
MTMTGGGTGGMDGGTGPGAGRSAELAANLAAVRHRIAAACAAAGRTPAEVVLITVTKTFPAADVRLLAGLGLSEFGESRDAEARAKAAELAGLPIRWHFVGQVQTNKAGSVARYADVVHSVDRPELVTALDRGAAAHRDRPLDVLLQVSLDSAPAAGRGGADPAAVPALADRVEAAKHLGLAGLMAVAPLGADPGPAFARLAELAAALRADHPAATVLSAGMSGDLEAAVRHGATHVRVGTALLGGRSGLVR